MIIKKFQGKTEDDAVVQAKSELGPGVVIMSVRKVKKKGLAGLFGGQVTEVTVAIEEENEQKAMPTINLATPPMTKVPDLKDVAGTDTPQKDSAPVAESINSGLERLRALSVQAEKSQQEAREAEVRSRSKTEEETALKARLAELQAMTEPQEKDAENEKSEPVSAVERLSKFNASMEEAAKREAEKEKVSSELKKELGDEPNAFVKLLKDTMIDNEVQEVYANQILDDVAKSLAPGAPMDSLLSGVYQKMILKFGKQVGITPASKGPKVLFFVGPTGVGKTTTIAKIASKFSVEEKKKIALLTADTYRIAATEQLRTYANILEVPFRVIYSVEEVDTALNDWKDCEYILVDTAGHSHHNEEQKNNMNDFIHSVDDKNEKEVFLVVSATTKYRDLKNIADVYSSMTDYKLIFTKLDETDTLGNILNIKLYTGASLSYVTCGQNVPDDIENFNPQKTVKQLLGGKNN